MDRITKSLLDEFSSEHGVDRLPRPNSHEMQRYCESILDLLWDVEKADALFARAAGAVDAVAQGNFDRDYIRTQPFTESLKDQCNLSVPEEN